MNGHTNGHHDRRRPRLGFLGMGWIGRLRLEAVVKDDQADVVAIADPSVAARTRCADLVPQAQACSGLQELFELDLDGIVIATPSALHAAQAERVLAHGLGVFCQKPLGRNATEVARVIAAARRFDRRLGVDFCYRHLTATRAVQALVAEGTLGDIYAAQVTFHNAYGPDKAWFYDPSKSGGGCLIDLGVHMLDLASFVLGASDFDVRSAQLFASGQPCPGRTVTEDFATADLCLGGRTAVQLACSWGLSAGKDAVIRAEFFGTRGAAAMTNVDGSFFDFRAEHHQGTSSRVMVEPPDDWGGRALNQWVRDLARDCRFDATCESYLVSSRAVDRIYETDLHSRGNLVFDACSA